MLNGMNIRSLNHRAIVVTSRHNLQNSRLLLLTMDDT
nr:MAG TPA: hypothetical protein [Caudoviricetes sp.]